VERTTIAGETEVLGENLPQRHFFPPQIPHDQVRFRTPDRSGGKPATNRLSYGATSSSSYCLFNIFAAEIHIRMIVVKMMTQAEVKLPMALHTKGIQA
jgi:hypothetical protein